MRLFFSFFSVRIKRQVYFMVNIWRETFPVRFGSVDRSDRLTLGAVFSIFQETAISHAADLGVGRDALGETGQGWVLSRISVFMERRPRYGDVVTAESWPRGTEKLFALRDYCIRDGSAAAIVRGRGGWLIVDIEKRRPLRPQQVIEKLPPNDGINALLSGGIALGSRENLARTGERRAGYSDIDYYGHVNNARYIQWIQDITDPEILDRAEQLRLDINYVNEILPGETVELWSAPMDGAPPAGAPAADYPSLPASGFACEGRRPDDGSSPASNRTVFRAELRFG
jgi:acyl-ACP thioesterase